MRRFGCLILTLTIGSIPSAPLAPPIGPVSLEERQGRKLLSAQTIRASGDPFSQEDRLDGGAVPLSAMEAAQAHQQEDLLQSALIQANLGSQTPTRQTVSSSTVSKQTVSDLNTTPQTPAVISAAASGNNLYLQAEPNQEPLLNYWSELASAAFNAAQTGGSGVAGNIALH